MAKLKGSQDEDLTPRRLSDDSDYDCDSRLDIDQVRAKQFMCGVVEGFYGRPWNTNQRIELFARMKQFGMNTYLYAPKDDVKHRAYWRDLYTVEEAESLTELIQSAVKHDITFVYAISPGLDITYSSSKDTTILRRKLDQVSSFGCKAFALLFDDIEPEMNKADKEVFQSFAHAQASVTNQMYEHLKNPMFMFCPTEYCASRAVPTVTTSQYLNTIGEKLLPGIDIMWTGPKVVSRVISLASIKQLTKVIRRRPLIWDNIHANDYDQKRIFLGPYTGRSPALIPLLSGVLTNPNCEFEPNYVAFHTLATWSKSYSADFVDRSPVIARETLVEREGMSTIDGDDNNAHGYDEKSALMLALKEWLPVVYEITHVDGGRPMPVKTSMAPTPMPDTLPPVLDPVVSNIPTTVTTCMAVTPTTQTAPVGLAVPVEALVGDVEVPPEAEAVTSPACQEPMEVIAPLVCPSADDIPERELLPNSLVNNPPTDTDMQVDEDIEEVKKKDRLTLEELSLICDMFYLPYEHGGHAVRLLTEFDWLKTNAHVVHKSNLKSRASDDADKVSEWNRRADEFMEFSNKFKRILSKWLMIPNRCLHYDMNAYLSELRGTLSTLCTFLKWLVETGLMSEEDSKNLEYRITWTSKGYSEAFMSGDNEPWVFRGGLTGELQRSLPLDATDLFVPNRPFTENSLQESLIYTIRPYMPADEAAVYDICREANLGGHRNLPQNLLPDLLVGGLLSLHSHYCFVVENQSGVCGYAIAAPDAKDFHQKMKLSWLPEMQSKYPLEGCSEEQKDLVKQFHDYKEENSQQLISDYPAILRVDMSNQIDDIAVTKKVLACIFSALKSVGVHGVHCLAEAQHDHFYRLLGFSPYNPSNLTNVEAPNSTVASAVYVRYI